MGPIVEALVNIVRYARGRKRKGGAGPATPGDGWGAMVLEQSGPARSDPVVPARRVDLGNRK